MGRRRIKKTERKVFILHKDDIDSKLYIGKSLEPEGNKLLLFSDPEDEFQLTEKMREEIGNNYEEILFPLSQKDDIIHVIRREVNPGDGLYFVGKTMKKFYAENERQIHDPNLQLRVYLQKTDGVSLAQNKFSLANDPVDDSGTQSSFFGLAANMEAMKEELSGVILSPDGNTEMQESEENAVQQETETDIPLEVQEEAEPREPEPKKAAEPKEAEPVKNDTETKQDVEKIEKPQPKPDKPQEKPAKPKPPENKGKTTAQGKPQGRTGSSVNNAGIPTGISSSQANASMSQEELDKIKKAIYSKPLSNLEFSEQQSELDKAKAVLLNLMIERFKRNILKYTRYDMTVEQAFKFLRLIRKSTDEVAFSKNWNLAEPDLKFAMERPAFIRLLKEAQYYTTVSRMLYGEDELWEA